MKIFLLEDNNVFIDKFTEFAVDKLGYSITVSNSILKYEFIEADIYLIDLQIGNDYSWDVIKDIKSKTDKQVIMFTHHTDNNLLKKWIESWADSYFCKTERDSYSSHLAVFEYISKK